MHVTGCPLHIVDTQPAPEAIQPEDTPQTGDATETISMPDGAEDNAGDQ